MLHSKTLIAGLLIAVLGPIRVDAAGPEGPSPDALVYYFDGAGGGGLVLNWGRSVRRGLKKAGFVGRFIDSDWQTGMGPLVDHSMSDEAKRDKAWAAAQEIAGFINRNPGADVHLIGLSAGTAILLHTLEALPAGTQVDTVVLLSSSVSAEYDLSRALTRVRGRLYSFASRFDPVLGALVPMVGTADREFSLGDTAGLIGFRRPDRAAEDSVSLYSKVINVRWRPEFARYGHLGTHTGATSSDFIAKVVAPLLRPAQRTNR